MKQKLKLVWLVFLCIMLVAIVSNIVWDFINRTRAPWYLGCADSGGQEYLIKVDEKPYIREGFIVIGKDTFIAPIQGMTCKIITENDFNARVKLKDTSNSVI